MKALVLAAGRGSRLGAAGGGLPKPLTDVGGTSPLEHVLQWISAFALVGIWINVHEAADVVMQRIGDQIDGVPISYSHEPELLGTAGAWKKLASEWTDTALVIYGDNFMRFDLNALLRTHREAGNVATIAIYDPERHANTGVGGGRVVLQGQRVTQFVEGGDSGPINAGAYLLEPQLAARLPHGFLDFGHDVLPGLAAAGELTGHVLEPGAYCLGVDTPERLQTARELVRMQEATT